MTLFRGRSARDAVLAQAGERRGVRLASRCGAAWRLGCVRAGRSRRLERRSVGTPFRDLTPFRANDLPLGQPRTKAPEQAFSAVAGLQLPCMDADPEHLGGVGFRYPAFSSGGGCWRLASLFSSMGGVSPHPRSGSFPQVVRSFTGEYEPTRGARLASPQAEETRPASIAPNPELPRRAVANSASTYSGPPASWHGA